MLETRIAALLEGLPAADLVALSAASPIGGLAEVRDRWGEHQRRGISENLPSSRPFAVSGLSHGLALVADLYAEEGTPVVVPEPYWGNYRQAFSIRRGARIVLAPSYVEGRFDPEGIARAIDTLPRDRTAIAILNFPSNPGGYSPTKEERERLLDALVGAAASAPERPLVVVCDDAYAGLVFEPEISRGSLFWDLVARREEAPNLLPIKIDGATKEFSFFGGRVGFLTFPAEGHEEKLARHARAGAGPPSALSQMVLLQALRDGNVGSKIEAIRAVLEGRYRALRDELAEVDPDLVQTFPFNSGCFALVEIPEALGLTSDQVRRHLIEAESVALISLEPRLLRIAHCSVAAEAIPELARRLERGIAVLAGR
ncbi:MAG TPA: aminotransferase class I/II-fold pyridoxal phosphate-dependent enzyme [Thermoanaerobaculia bacterium]|jgi:aspartate/methionine/tyrosine aminotransferase|nr:aminotransferase class I/II-fold pyridoxal phosphate-dependent enzyme [Thermoanaerobaculia bacterium]